MASASASVIGEPSLRCPWLMPVLACPSGAEPPPQNRTTKLQGSRPRLAGDRRVLPYGLDMPASKRPAPQDAATARQILIAGLARDADIFGIESELAPLHPRNDTFPGEVFLRVGADALEQCGASR